MKHLVNFSDPHFLPVKWKQNKFRASRGQCWLLTTECQPRALWLDLRCRWASWPCWLSEASWPRVWLTSHGASPLRGLKAEILTDKAKHHGGGADQPHVEPHSCAAYGRKADWCGQTSWQRADWWSREASPVASSSEEPPRGKPAEAEFTVLL